MAQMFLFLFILIAGLFVSVPAWEASKPLLHWFLTSYGASIPGGLREWMVMASPVMVYLVVVFVLFTVLQGILIFCRQTLEEWMFNRWQRKINGRNRRDR